MATLNITFSSSNVKSYLNAVSAEKVVVNPKTGETLQNWLRRQGSTTQLVIAETLAGFPLVGDSRNLYLAQDICVLYVFADGNYIPVTSGEGGTIPVNTKANLPAVGNEGSLYIVRKTNEIYRWSDDLVAYIPCSTGIGAEELEFKIDSKIGSALDAIEVISGGTAEIGTKQP